VLEAWGGTEGLLNGMMDVSYDRCAAGFSSTAAQHVLSNVGQVEGNSRD